MKKLISSLILFVFFFIGLGHSSMMVFAGTKMESMSYSQENNDQKKCLYSCCIEQSTEHGVTNISQILKKQAFKICNPPYKGNIDFIIGYTLEDKDLINKTSPPYIERNIKNYSYHTLIQIVKSNT